jgi:drug/metabolite transporter (DMT)-like permease
MVTRRGWLLFASMCVIWGVPYLMIRVAVRELAPSMLVLLRTGIAALLLLPIAAVRGELRPLLPHWKPLVVFAAVEIAIPWLFLARAEEHLTSSLAGLLIAAVPLVGAAVLFAIGGDEGLGGRRLVGLVVGLLGVAALVGIDVGDLNVVALLEIAIVVVGYAVGPIILSRTLQGAPALGVVAASLGLTTLVYLPALFFAFPESWPSGRVVASVAGLAILCTAVAFLLFFALIADIGPVRATVITYVNPAVAAVLGVLVLDEKLTFGMAVGFALILVGSVLATSRAREPAELETAPA